MKTGYQWQRLTLASLTLILLLIAAPAFAQEGGGDASATACPASIGDYDLVQTTLLEVAGPNNDGFISYYRLNTADETGSFDTWRYCFMAPEHIPLPPAALASAGEDVARLASFAPAKNARPLGVEGTLCSKQVLDLKLSLDCLGPANIVGGGEWSSTGLSPWGSDFQVIVPPDPDSEPGKIILRYNRTLDGGRTRNIYFSLDQALAEGPIEAETTDTYAGYGGTSSGMTTGPTDLCCQYGEVFGSLYLDVDDSGTITPADTKMSGDVNLLLSSVPQGTASASGPSYRYSFPGLDPTSSLFEVDCDETTLPSVYLPIDPVGFGPVTVIFTPADGQTCARQDFLYDPDITLPVEIQNFVAVAEGSNIELRWESASEANNSGYSIEQKMSADVFEEVGFVDGAGTSRSLREYSYRLNDVTPAVYTFRLKQIDFDGNATYSDEIEVDVSNPDRYFVGSAYPNPFNPQTTISLSVTEAQNVRVVVHDALGRAALPVADRPMDANRPYEIRIDASVLPSGVYIVRFLGETFNADRQIILTK